MSPGEDEAFQSDTYIEALLASQGWPAPGPGEVVPLERVIAVGARSPDGAPPRPAGPAGGRPRAVRPAAGWPATEPSTGGPLDAARRDPLGLDPELAAAAELLAGNLVRFHPSFRFEEALLWRLRAAAAAQHAGTSPVVRGVRSGAAPGASRVSLLALPAALPTLARPQPLAQTLALLDAGRAIPHVPLPFLAASAIASGVSIAGAAALVAWRRTRRPA